LNTLYLLLGTNIGDKKSNLREALAYILADIGDISKASKVYSTGAWGKTDQDDFLNQVICVTTKKSPSKILKAIHSIEKKMGRVRKEKWSERIIDIDILYFNDEIIVQKDLKIPHPELHKRRFTLIPLSEIAPDLRHPVLNLTTLKLLFYCEDMLPVQPID
jgi:2-amino-4-hydroxy-6-hydroxymethyldihydropteridine diphosphokinase